MSKANPQFTFSLKITKKIRVAELANKGIRLSAVETKFLRRCLDELSAKQYFDERNDFITKVYKEVTDGEQEKSSAKVGS